MKDEINLALRYHSQQKVFLKCFSVKKPAKHRQRARCSSPYSTDSNYSTIQQPHRPYPKSDRRRQLREQAAGVRHVGLQMEETGDDSVRGMAGVKPRPPVMVKPTLPHQGQSTLELFFCVKFFIVNKYLLYMFIIYFSALKNNYLKQTCTFLILIPEVNFFLDESQCLKLKTTASLKSLTNCD